MNFRKELFKSANAGLKPEERTHTSFDFLDLASGLVIVSRNLDNLVREITSIRSRKKLLDKLTFGPLTGDWPPDAFVRREYHSPLPDGTYQRDCYLEIGRIIDGCPETELRYALDGEPLTIEPRNYTQISIFKASTGLTTGLIYENPRDRRLLVANYNESNNLNFLQFSNGYHEDKDNPEAFVGTQGYEYSDDPDELRYLREPDEYSDETEDGFSYKVITDGKEVKVVMHKTDNLNCITVPVYLDLKDRLTSIIGFQLSQYPQIPLPALDDGWRKRRDLLNEAGIFWTKA